MCGVPALGCDASLREVHLSDFVHKNRLESPEPRKQRPSCRNHLCADHLSRVENLHGEFKALLAVGLANPCASARVRFPTHFLHCGS